MWKKWSRNTEKHPHLFCLPTLDILSSSSLSHLSIFPQLFQFLFHLLFYPLVFSSPLQFSLALLLFYPIIFPPFLLFFNMMNHPFLSFSFPSYFSVPFTLLRNLNFLSLYIISLQLFLIIHFFPFQNSSLSSLTSIHFLSSSSLTPFPLLSFPSLSLSRVHYRPFLSLTHFLIIIETAAAFPSTQFTENPSKS